MFTKFLSSKRHAGPSRSRWAAIGAATAVAVGFGGLVSADASSLAPTGFVPISPCRLVDTRINVQHSGALGAGQTMLVAAYGSNGACVLPADAQALAINVTAVQGTRRSFMTTYPGDEVRPFASSLNWDAGTFAIANEVTVGLSTSGQFNVYNNEGTVDVVIDVAGYYLPAGPAIAGVAGAKGDPGAPGPSGPAGPKGDQGVPGTVVYDGAHWGLIDRNTIGSPVGALRSGPYEGTSTPPLGIGSLGFSVKDGTEKVAFGNEIDFFGQPVTGITAVGFHVFWTGEDKAIGADNLPNITFEVDPTGTANATGPNYSSLVFVPFGAPLLTNRFNAIDATSATAGWWYFTNGTTASTTGCGQAGPLCSFADLQTAVAQKYPEMSVISLAVGKGRDSAWNGAVDALQYNGSVYDFEPFGVTATPAP